MTNTFGSGETKPWWGAPVPQDGEQPPSRADTIVVGAGIAGLSVAYHLLKLGHSVVVLDKNGVGAGETGRSTAHLCDALDDRYFLLERMHGVEAARLAAESHRAAIESIERIAREERIECGFRYLDGYLFEADAARSGSVLGSECEAAARAGLEVELTSGDMADRFSSAAILKFGRQAQIDPLAYVRGLAAAFERRGGSIHSHCLVRSIERDGLEWELTLDDGHRIHGLHVIVATNSPINDRFAIHSKQAAYRTYVVAFQAPRDLLPKALFWDTGDPYHYIRWADEETLIVGGADHRVGMEAHPQERWIQLEQWARARFPRLGVAVSHWSGQILEPADGLAYIGREPTGDEGCFVSTGDSGNGMTHGALAGLLIPDLIQEKANEWARFYDPARKPTATESLKKYVVENTKVAIAYGDWLKAPREKHAELASGRGEVVQRGLHKIAVYVDERGNYTERSAVCTHLGGIVHWNAAEQSWDCPCHGSRFDPQGRVIAGPASSDLAPAPRAPGPRTRSRREEHHPTSSYLPYSFRIAAPDKP